MTATARAWAPARTTLDANFVDEIFHRWKHRRGKAQPRCCQLDKLSCKTARETLRRDARAIDDAGYLTNLIYPERHPQEHFSSIVPFLAQHGLDLPQRLKS